MKNRLLAYTAGPLAFLVLMAGAALAVEVADTAEDETTEMVASETVVTPTWNDEDGIITISLAPEGENGCEGEDAELATTRDDEGNIVWQVDGEDAPEDFEAPEGCLVFDGTGPNGQVNHGTMTSAVAKSLSPHDLDIPKGWVMREVAKHHPDDFTSKKPNKPNKGDGGDEDEDSLEEDRADDKPKGKSQGRGRADKAGNKRG